MGGFFTIQCSPSRPGRAFCLVWAVGLLVVWSVLTPAVYSADRVFSLGQAVASQGRVARPVSRRVPVDDVVLRGGTLYGVVVADATAPGEGKAVARTPVVLLHDGKVVAEVRTDQAGRFAVTRLRGGKYVLAVSRGDRVEWSVYRAWTPSSAPPKASAVARLVSGKGVVRGQGPLPGVSFSETALMAGVVVGAVAAPVIYHNAQQSNRVPASP